MAANRPSRLVWIVLLLALAAAPSCRGAGKALENYGEGFRASAPPAAGAAIGAAIGGPLGAAIGACIGGIVSFFEHKLERVEAENVQLRIGDLYGKETAHALVLPGFTPRDVVPWYLNPWMLGKLIAGWAALVFVVSFLVWKFGHPFFRVLRGLLTFGVAPAIGAIRTKTEKRAGQKLANARTQFRKFDA